MPATRKERYCRCGTRLTRANIGPRCIPCLIQDGDRDAAQRLPKSFWDQSVVSEALRNRHMGHVIRAWRTHPFHGRRPIPQDRIASWFGITQAQLSRVENGPPLGHLDRLVQWAELLGIPPDRLWFAMPDNAPAIDQEPVTEQEPATDQESVIDQEEATVDRRRFMASTSLTLAGGLIGMESQPGMEPQPSPGSLLSVPGTRRWAVESFAWRLWQAKVQELHRSEIPTVEAVLLDGHPHVIRTRELIYRFTTPTLVDKYVARRVFAGILQGDDEPLEASQTTHRTDLSIGSLAAEDSTAQRHLMSWMRHGATPVLRVNSAGILAKVGVPELGDTAVSAIREDWDARHLYLTAVTARVLSTPWEQAGRLAGYAATHAASLNLSGSSATGLEQGQEFPAVRELAAELSNQRDAGARWCAAVLLSSLPDVDRDGTRTALVEAVRRETCRENLRAYAAVLAGTNPLTI